MQKEPENCMTKQESKVDVLNRLRILLMSKQPSGSFNQMWLAPCGLLIARIRIRVPHPRGVVFDRGVPSSVPESLSASPCHGFSITQLQFQVKPRGLNLTEKLQNISILRGLRPQSQSDSWKISLVTRRPRRTHPSGAGVSERTEAL